MKVNAIRIENVRGFQSVLKTDLSESIKIFIRANNTGKSTRLKSIFLLQRKALGSNDIKIETDHK